MKNILVLTSIYPEPNSDYEGTPVIHYFAKEWVKMGYNVSVIYYRNNFPKIYHFLFKPFSKLISSKIGYQIASINKNESIYKVDGVTVYPVPLLKFIPHGNFTNKKLDRIYKVSIKILEDNNIIPDIITSHWANPQYEIMRRLKKIYNAKTCYVAHGGGRDLYKLFPGKVESLIASTDILGYRSQAIKRDFEKNYSIYNKPSFMCYSGVPSGFICNDVADRKQCDAIKDFIFVGTLIKRKYPDVLIPALVNSYKSDKFNIYYCGDGKEINHIKSIAKKKHCENNVHLLGKVDRKKVSELLNQCDVFVMISENETFGLVYLEAMAAGCITIASKDEGFDGIIVDGINGFLCKAGDSKELEILINKIRNMNSDEISVIRRNAIQTAMSMTDSNMALNYIESLLKN